ncbi:MAG: 3-oxoacyl-ACP synthase III family protein [Burkholderia contaminans]|uniref:3-oxoacyl-ACP synthase III family protein n=1 Tax=Burkholderia contaminans TaxID=488447 RepID=A0AAP4RAG6_9BURK|nr:MULTISPECIES: 3-oxoacyl-ACP synthase III family protein [Burkholderia]MBD1416286.1 3-oxoacyl-ACP synthase III family protein [Burkholderia contaminans]MBH9672009.1 3-oxoacyl-ACP synthase III family protein [Burkholderia contaminans]MBH9679279.1 3-oxoacyl-ACP synthase III family protein [Burkholderia contaminans]MBH9709326.1 3-oxoacyl-ACP synthase III family protein [Burkholderia contaminans]MBM6425744.1 3-oxoacyl-ACP synthase III family protein [Burkholderia contaminans]
MVHNVRIASLACRLPARQVPNDDPVFAGVEPIPSEWWQFWGIESRYMIDPAAGESELALAERTARDALARAGVEAAELDLVLFNMTSPFVSLADGQRRFAPRLARTLRDRLGATRALDADVEMECASFVLQLQIAANLIKQGRVKRALVCSSERMSAVVDYTSKSSTNFGDGAAAAVLVAEPADPDGADWLDAAYRSDATHYDLVTMQWRHAHAATDDDVATDADNPFGVYFTLKPEAQEAIARFMPVAIPDIVEQLLQRSGTRAADVDAMVFHQPSALLVRAWAQRLGLKPDQYVIRVADCACLVSAAVPFALYESIREGVIRPGSLVVIAGAGAGWGFGAQLWRWGETVVTDAGDAVAAVAEQEVQA